MPGDKEILAALEDGIGAAKSELATRPKMYHRRTLLFLMSQAANARPALKRMLERLEKLEAENAKLRRLVPEAYRDGFAAGCFPNANVDDAWPQSMTFADLNAENKDA